MSHPSLLKVPEDLEKFKGTSVPLLINSCEVCDSSSSYTRKIRAKIISLYAQVYVYEIRFVLQYVGDRAHRAARNVVSADEWKTM